MHRLYALTAALVAVVVLLATPAPAAAECRPYPVTPESPTGIVGCVIYGDGVASHWPGPGVARNDCVWPWTTCQPIRILSHDTGLTIVVTPTMYCDCYSGTPDERIVDLDPEALRRLGLDPQDGLYDVRVTPAGGSATLPDTAVPAPK